MSGERGYTLLTLGMNESFMLILWSYGLDGGRILADGSSKTFLKVEYSGGKKNFGCFCAAAAASSRAWETLAMVEVWRNLNLHQTIRPIAYAVCALWQNSSGGS